MVGEFPKSCRVDASAGPFGVVVFLRQSIGQGFVSLKKLTEIGEHPDSKHKIYTSIGQYGPIVQLIDGTKVITTAPIKPPLCADTLTIEEAVEKAGG